MGLAARVTARRPPTRGMAAAPGELFGNGRPAVIGLERPQVLSGRMAGWEGTTMWHYGGEYEQEKVAEFLVAAYVVDELGILGNDHFTDLDALAAVRGVQEWRDRVASCLEAEFGVNGDAIRSVYRALSKHMPEEQAICFILRGLGYPHIRGLDDVME